MAVNISNEFHRTSTNPIDDSLTLSKTQMLNMNDNLMPSKYFTICQDDGYMYLYDKSATPNSTTGKFTKFEGGGSTSDCVKYDGNDVIDCASLYFDDIIPDGDLQTTLGTSLHRFYRSFVGETNTDVLKFTKVTSDSKTHTAEFKYDSGASTTAFKIILDEGDEGELTLPHGVGTIALKSDIPNLYDGKYIPMPRGANYTTNTPSVTGSLKITLPTGYTSHMMMFWVDIYNYDANGTTVSYLISGYNYSGTYTWYNVSAVCFGSGSHAGLNVRFGDDSTKCCVFIGETNTTWSYPQVSVRDLTIGYSDFTPNYLTGWNISFVSSFPSNITENITSTTFSATGHTHSYLPLSGGTITGSLTVNGSFNNNNINATDGNGMLAYKPSNWSYVSSSQWGLGATNCQGVIRSNNSDLIHAKNGTSYTIYDSSNFPKASSSTYGGAKIYASGDTLYITTT